MSVRPEMIHLPGGQPRSREMRQSATFVPVWACASPSAAPPEPDTPPTLTNEYAVTFSSLAKHPAAACPVAHNSHLALQVLALSVNTLHV